MMIFPKISHVITDLNGFGGAEATLLRYLKGSKIPAENHQVIVLKSIGSGDTLGTQIVAAGFKVIAMNQSGRSMSFKALNAVYDELNAFQADIVFGWLYHPCLIVSLLAPFLGHKPKVIWHILSLPFVFFRKHPGRFIVQRLLVVLSWLTKPLMISNSSVAMAGHEAIGFRVSPERLAIISNGIDLNEYRPESDDKHILRSELGIPLDAMVIGCVGRFVPEKGYEDMFKALILLNEMLPPALLARLHFVGVGHGVNNQNQAFMGFAKNVYPDERLHLFDKRSDVSKIFRALDVFVLPSISEAFPNVLLEAMASGLSCLTTDVGQTREALSMPDFVVPASVPEQLAERLKLLLEMSAEQRRGLGMINRNRVAEHYNLQKMIASFDSFFMAQAE